MIRHTYTDMLAVALLEVSVHGNDVIVLQTRVRRAGAGAQAADVCGSAPLARQDYGTPRRQSTPYHLPPPQARAPRHLHCITATRAGH